MTEQRKVTHLTDYTPANFLITDVILRFELGEEQTQVKSQLSVRRNPNWPNTADVLKLAGEGLSLETIALDGCPLAEGDFQVDEHQLTVKVAADEFTLEITNTINPKANTALSGLYLSSGNFCTQCEAEGFRRITYFLDRPDVMALFTTTIIADKQRYPVLLSNGNLMSEMTLPDGRYSVTWHDPFPKPCYLFALVAGKLAVVEDHFTTSSGREVLLQVYVEPENQNKCDQALYALKSAMRWDEQRFQREYDLDRYMVVAVNDFNMGAMENKGLNIFNAKYALCHPTTATDTDYQNVEAVIAHEYFHNWTGNRITCRDWFQLSLKEGLTIFREQSYCADQWSRHVKRIDDVKRLRSEQFPQDAGPLAHPVRPDSYIEINNFYTVTIYEKGAEVLRMLQTLLGQVGFDRGMALYFDRHDGQAVTIEDFVAAMEDANDCDLGQFRYWYSQAGTPTLSLHSDYDPEQAKLKLQITQSCPPTPGQPHKQAFLLPFKLALFNEQGELQTANLLDMAEGSENEQEFMLPLSQYKHEFTFTHVKQKPILSILREFCAPVKIEYDYTDEELLTLVKYDNDGFARWEALQQLASRKLLQLINPWQQEEALELPALLREAFAQMLQQTVTDPRCDKLYMSELLLLPSYAFLADKMQPIDVEGIVHIRRFVQQQLSQQLQEYWQGIYHSLHTGQAYVYDSESLAARKLKNLCLNYLTHSGDASALDIAFQQYQTSDNMTDKLAALDALNHIDCSQRDTLLDDFYHTWEADPLVLDTWFAVQARSPIARTFECVQALLQHPKFNRTNPNRVRSVIMSFSRVNPVHFHRQDGTGYQWLAEQVRQYDSLNPQLAARLVEPLTHWRRHNSQRQALMQAQLQSLLAQTSLSKDTYEIVSKSLA